MNINWSYYFDDIKSRKFYIFGFLLLISVIYMDEWKIIGPTVTQAQELSILPSSINMAIILQKAAILVIFAVSWDLLSGYSGQVSFGHALFLGMGAYLSALIKLGPKVGESYIFPGIEDNYQVLFGINLDVSVLQAIFYAASLVSLFALFLGALTLRMKGPYFALVTLVLPLIAQILVSKIWGDYTGGDGGITILNRAQLIQDPIESELVGLEIYSLKIEQLFVIVLILTILCVGIMNLIAKSRYGLVLRSIREDELAASSSGININFYKLSVFIISSFFAAIAGGLFVQSLGTASSSIFVPTRSFEVIIFTILGGIGTIAGGVVGTFVLIFAISIYIDKGFVEIPTIEVLIFGLILIIVLRYQPRGLVNAKPQLRNALFFGVFISILTAFYDTGVLWPWMSERINPAVILENLFGENEKGLIGINILVVQGRMILYFILGTITGFYGPELLQKTRLKVWGVWPNLGKFDTVK
ncbi:MAG: branched-chain amino acid ABC transporter permease [Candidatus Heimdallarchaeota archaeon]|nr:branched-chain amino acid ABC transporter permease [Candidatus Heimdallarchaeota archaeon]